ncbi:PfkB family carbohydrate kinase [Azospirillum isscasi]|uniref:PfkB family carbohydrate kinase n=1 Tax=Azospirillum isscasi TaxID=3053926 RepID=A0ABU0WNR0_9PROT|nr:PfkB family carbohydrate kinase [Azospirillum isscasi]MDQ2105850.1 PfkB family carbohydrate kinase [Azospirillum isscasi]
MVSTERPTDRQRIGGKEGPLAPSRQKVRTLDEAAAVAEQARREGRRVALAHGVFDLLHLGHVRHLEEARSHGDVLIVTVTADAYVNKGPGRPVFSEQLRAQMVAALEHVDAVAVNHAPTAVDVLHAIRPDVYVKGPDYANADEDVTGGIVDERTAVEAHGGRIVFTDDITFSSSSLINKYLGVYDTELHAFLETARESNLLPQLIERLESVRDYKVVLVGDTIIDEYRYVLPMGKSPKENMIATLFRNQEIFAGGVIAAANHIAAFCREVEILTCLGEEETYDSLIAGSLKPNVSIKVVRRPGKPTTCKTRFVETGYMRKLFEVYEMDDSPLSEGEEKAVQDLIATRAADGDLVVVTDFGHGMITPAIIETLQKTARFLAVNTQTNSANQGYNLVTRYSRADYVCIDAPEARLALADKFTDIALLAAEKLPARVDCNRLVITQGKLGCVCHDGAAGTHRIPAFTNMVVDTVGAGDAFFAVTAPLVAAGVPMDQVGFIGNAAGAIKVGIVGHRRSVEKVPLIKLLTAILK